MTGQRNYGLDFMKFMAAIMITNSHFIPLYKDINVGLATFGVHGNALFFFVAGYLLIAGLYKKELSFYKWYYKRIVRIWPAVVIWSLLIALVSGKTFTWDKILLMSDYWFLQTIAVYYILFFFVGKLMIKSKLVGLYSFLCSVGIALAFLFLMPQGQGSIFHTCWHYVCHFSIMVMGGLTYIYKDKILENKNWSDWVWLAISFLIYFVIVGVGKNATDWIWYTQLIAIIPLHAFCYYGYKICSRDWCNRLMIARVWRMPFTIIAALTLEIYVVQFDIITDMFNGVFPLNNVIVLGMICMAAYILRVMVNGVLMGLGIRERRIESLYKL